MAAAEQRLSVFVSYSHADAAWLASQVHLRPLVGTSRSTFGTTPGSKRARGGGRRSGSALAKARVAVLLISADLFGSDFIATKELPPLLEAERKRGLVILGVHLSASRFDRDQVLSEYQTVNSPGRPIESLARSDQEVVFDALARRIEELLAASDRVAAQGGLDVVPLPPKPARCIGRDEQVATLVGALLAGAPAAVLGPAGIGKSTVCLQALHDQRVADRFGERRCSVRLDGAATAKDTLAAIAAMLGIPADQASLGSVVGRLATVTRRRSPSTIWRRRGRRRPTRSKRCSGSLPRHRIVARGDAAPGAPAGRGRLARAGSRSSRSGGGRKRVFLGSPAAGMRPTQSRRAGRPSMRVELTIGCWHGRRATEGLGCAGRRSHGGRRPQADQTGSRSSSRARTGMTVVRGAACLLGARTAETSKVPGGGNAAAATPGRSPGVRRGAPTSPAGAIREHVAACHPPALEGPGARGRHYAGMAAELGPKSAAAGGVEPFARLAAEYLHHIEQMLRAVSKRTEPRSGHRGRDRLR